jgi:hypothetical protein
MSETSFSQNTKLSTEEANELSIFASFKDYLVNKIKDKSDITDSDNLNYILNHYAFVNIQAHDNKKSVELNDLSNEQMISFKKEIKNFYRFLQEREEKKLGENLSAIPIRLSSDTFIYKNLTSFQKQNTIVFYDKRFPKTTLGYLLFMPSVKDKRASPRIWSWTLLFKFGKYMFQALTGEEGYEYIFSPEKFKK